MIIANILSGPAFDRIDGPKEIAIEGDRIRVSGTDAPSATLLATPALVNAHDHGYGIATLACGAPDDALECWIPGLANRPQTDPELEAKVAFGRMALSGIGTTVHCHNSLRRDRIADEARAAATAAEAVGMRVAFSCPITDRNPHVYGDPSPLAGLGYPPELLEAADVGPSGAEQIDNALAVRDAHQTDRFNVQLGPIGPQWCAFSTLETIAEISARENMRVHMHLLETERQRQWLDQEWPEGPIRRLDAIGLLSPRLTIAHGVWLRPDECELLAERGVTVAVNTSSNLRLRSGIAPVAAFIEHGLAFAVGLDGAAFDDDQDVFREWRLLGRLHSGMALTNQMPPARILKAAFADGFHVFDGQTDYGTLQPGSLADLLVLDLEPIIADRLNNGTSLLDLAFARLERRHVKQLIVAGEDVVCDGKLVGFDFDAANVELIAQARSSGGDDAVAKSEARREAIRRYYRDGRHMRT